MIHTLWTIKLDEHKKFFMWKIIMGAIPTGVKAVVRGLGSEVCAGCKAAVKTVLYLFHGCPCSQHLGAHLCSWIGIVWNVHISRLQLITASWGRQIEIVNSILAALSFCYLKFVWHLKNNRLFQGTNREVRFSDLEQSCLSTLLDLQILVGSSPKWAQL